MPPKSLLELTTAACLKHLKALESIGDFLPYDAVRHILLKVESPHQLRKIELNSPQIKGHTGELWLKLIEKDFPLEYKNNAYKPQNPDHWYRVWQKYKKEHDAAIKASEAKLKDALAGLRQDKAQNTSRIIERKLLPKSLRMAGAKKMYNGQRDVQSNSLTFNGGCRTKVNTGASVMRKVRREVKEIATIHGSLSKSIQAPIRPAQLSQIQKAPASMISDYRRSSQPQYRSTAALAPETRSALLEHEKRATFISDSEDNEDFDDDFDEMPKASSKLIRKPKPITQASPPSSTSLLKNKSPKVSSSQATPPTTQLPTPSATSSTVRKIKAPGGLLSNKFKGKVVGKPSTLSRPKASPAKTAVVAMPAPQSEAAKVPRSLTTHARTSTSPAPASSLSPPQPRKPAQPVAEPVPSSECVPRKRKPVDIFMRRPAKRVS
ncbi:hypothetical protein E4U57_007423 [Claviceps arundinis]|uniref:Elongin-A n=1 Tax=Claviceps arundinis TaxID=1623583 RepID=A0A9P7SNV7_9HYPO|nr:hypothetical protein E4U57_007423 [Claviceps arundinis]KAG5967265.1 hypothetical protein E4U56_000937 [Claviceps arundinis]